MVRWVGVILLTALCAPTLSAGGLTSENNKREQSPPPGADSHNAEALPSLRSQLSGTGILILDPLDSPELIKERLRDYFLEVGTDAPMDRRHAETERELDSLFAADGEMSGELPQFTFEFHQDHTLQTLRESFLDSNLARQGEELCSATCRFRELDNDGGVHIHLTRPSEEPGGSVLAFWFKETDGTLEEARKGQQPDGLDQRLDWLERYSEPGSEPKPSARLFGVRVYVGNPTRSTDLP